MGSQIEAARHPEGFNELQREHSQLSAQHSEMESLRAEVRELRRLTAQLATERSAGGKD